MFLTLGILLDREPFEDPTARESLALYLASHTSSIGVIGDRSHSPLSREPLEDRGGKIQEDLTSEQGRAIGL